MVNPIIIDRETGDKLNGFFDEVSEFVTKINKRYSLNYYEMIGVLQTLIFILHGDAMGDEDE